MKAIASVLMILMLAALISCSDDDNPNPDGAVADFTQSGGDTSQTGGDSSQTGGDSHPAGDSQQGTTDGGGLPADLATWCVGSTPKFRIGTQDQTSWSGMNAPGNMTGTVMTIEPQFVVGGTKHSFSLTVNYTQVVITPIKIDLANLQAGESVKKNGENGPEVPADKRKGIVEIVANPSGGGHLLKVCATVDGESWYFPGMPMG